MQQSNNVTLSIIIVSYNTKELLKECIESIVQNSKTPKLQNSKHQTSSVSYEIIIVDNNSQDGSPEMIKEQWIMDNEKKKNKSSTISHQSLMDNG